MMGTGAASSPAAARIYGDGSAPPAVDAITRGDLQRDVTFLASDQFRGRDAGTAEELRSATWLAEQARLAGLEPAGDDGTFFQWWRMRRVFVASSSRIEIGGVRLALGTDAVVVGPLERSVSGPIVWVGDADTTALDGMNLRGSIVAARLRWPNGMPAVGTDGLTPRRVARQAITQRTAQLRRRGATAIILVSDSLAETVWGTLGPALQRGSYSLDSGRVSPRADSVPVVWVHASQMMGTGTNARLDIRWETTVWPCVNVIARVRGSDPALRDEHVLFSAHQDHEGVAAPIAGDSIWNGADDNATTSAAILAVARAFAKQPARRSALFVWHDAEERGLLGSNYHAAHPVVPIERIVAVLNGDMIGRNSPDSAALLGSQPPHRNSPDLVAMAIAANASVSRFIIDSTWDRPSHPEGFYFRSDHLPYVRRGIPAVYFTTTLHPDYHTPRDEASRIDYAKLERISRWMYATGWAAATATQRPRLDANAKLER